MCALASKFYKDPRGCAVLMENGFSHEWARAAGQMAMQTAEFPQEDSTVVFMNLALFWYSVGEFHRSSMHAVCGWNTASVLGLMAEVPGSIDPLQAEIRRRRFWACFLLGSFQSYSIYSQQPPETTLHLRLPCHELQFQLGNPLSEITLKSEQPSQSIFGELIRVMILWSKVLQFIKKPDSILSASITEIQVLDGKIHHSWSRAAQSFPLNHIDMASVPLDELPNRLLLHVVYHQCFCALHSSIVPLFSWSAVDGSAPYAQQISGQTAFDHANAVSSLLEASSNLSWDSRRMPSFIGYAAYASCAVQIPFLWSSKPQIKQRAVQNLLANLKTIQVLGDHWTFIKVLGGFARHLYQAHARQALVLPGEPKEMSATELNMFRSTNSSKARLSILGHNTILVDRGSFATGPDDIGQLGPVNNEGIDHSLIPNVGEAQQDHSLSGFISHISASTPGDGRNDPGSSVHFPSMMAMLDPFPPYEDLHQYDFGGILSMPSMTEVSNGGNQFGQIDDWISELLHTEGG